MAQWQVIDPMDGGVVFTADSIHRNPVVRGGLYTARAWAKQVARENSEPEPAEPLRAVKVAN